MHLIFRIFGMLKRYRWMFIASIVMILLVCVTRLIAPYLTKILIDDVIGAGKRDLLFPIITALFSVMLVQGTLRFVRGYTSEYVSQSVLCDLRQQLYNHMEEMSFKFYDSHQIGEIMSRMTGDINVIHGFLVGSFVTIIDALFNFVGAMIMCMTLSWQLTLVVLVAISPFLAFVAFKFDKAIRPTYDAIREQNAVLNTRAQEDIAGVRVVKAFAREEFERKRFDKENVKQLNANLDMIRVWSKFNPILDFIGNLSPVIMVLLGGFLVITKVITLGDMVGFSGYVWMIANPMRMIGWMINTLNSTVSSAEKIFYYMDLGTTMREKEDAVFPENFRGHVQFNHVTFRYDEQPVLKDICLDVAPGKTLAIMGPTGSGKTSIINLLSRFYECSQGSVTLDGIDVKDLKLRPLREKIAYVTQETFLFSETVDNNIAFGRPEAQFEDIRHAADMARATEFIDGMAKKGDTVVGERGLGLSGGQKQRIAIARALCTKPTILVLDDATSAVDMETEFEIQRELRQDSAERTTFIIAHRISSVKDADEIIVLDQGKIIERGTHDDLIQHQGWYYRLYMHQYRDYVQMQSQLMEEVSAHG